MSSVYRTHEQAHIIAVDKDRVMTPSQLNKHIDAVVAALQKMKRPEGV